MNVNVLIFPNGIRACTTNIAGAHVDPFHINEEFLSDLQESNIVVPFDAIYAFTKWVRPIEKTSRAQKCFPISFENSSRMEHRIPFTRLPFDHYICQEEIDQNTPSALVQTDILLANFKTC